MAQSNNYSSYTGNVTTYVGNYIAYSDDLVDNTSINYTYNYTYGYTGTNYPTISSGYTGTNYTFSTPGYTGTNSTLHTPGYTGTNYTSPTPGNTGTNYTSPTPGYTGTIYTFPTTYITGYSGTNYTLTGYSGTNCSCSTTQYLINIPYIGTKIIPNNAEDSITFEDIQDGDILIDFKRNDSKTEYECGALYKESTFEFILRSNKNQFTMEPLDKNSIVKYTAVKMWS
jgi:hypothetical protein